MRVPDRGDPAVPGDDRGIDPPRVDRALGEPVGVGRELVRPVAGDPGPLGHPTSGGTPTRNGNGRRVPA